MDRPIGMGVVLNVKHRHAIRLKSDGKFLISLTKLVLEAKPNIFSTIKENLLILPSVFGICYHCHNLAYFSNKVCITKKHRL